MAAAQQQPVFRYFYTHTVDNAPPLVQSFGAWHGQELLFVFRHLDVAILTGPTGNNLRDLRILLAFPQ